MFVMTHQRGTSIAAAFLYAFIRRLAPFVGDRRAVAALEFALVLPVMLLMYIGASDVTRSVIANRDVDLLSRTISDLVSQQVTTASQPMQASTISTIFTAASAVMAPYSTNGLTMTVSAVDIKANGSNQCCQVLVRWSYTQGGTQRACSTPLTQVSASVPPDPTNFPAAIVTGNQNAGFAYTSGQSSYVIVADVTYSYQPIFSMVSSWFQKGMRKTTFMVPRAVSNPVVLATPVNAPSGQSGTVCF